MGYFAEAYPHVRFPIADGDKPGLRRAQLGGIHAIAAHFTLSKEAAIVVMPTGSGKTAVIFLSAFILRVARVLIITPSQLVRSQIAENAKSLDVLKRIGVLPNDMPGPKVVEVTTRRTSLTSWEELRGADLVVATPHCVSPGINEVVPPPIDLFDLVVADEAHHSEAPRWADVLRHFESSARALFTATPFRRDRREIKGRVVYHYPIREAHKDGIFGKLQFVPVDPPPGVNHDAALAKEAARVFQEDKEAGFGHCLMVRTDSKKKANELKDIYQRETALRLQVIHSDHSLAFTKKALERLKNAELDGVICVAMLGEGFDFPRLKIAAIHAPHKSLAVTLQFIGRFARTSGEQLGEAKFLAVPQDIQSEIGELYRESAVWQDLVANLSASRVEEEVKAKEIATSFEPLELPTNISKDLSLDAFQPYFHVTIYRVGNEPDFNSHPDLGDDTEIIWHAVSKDFPSAVLLLRQVTKPRWTDREAFSRVEHDLVVLHFHKESRLLFISSTRRTLEFYRLIGEHYSGGSFQILSLAQINRVLAGIANPEFFNVGMKSSVQNSNTESYRIIAGPNAHKAISPTDSRLYHRGHVFGKGETQEGEVVTLGYSSSSKVWSNQNGRIADLITWCEDLARRLGSNAIVTTHTELDLLGVGEEVSDLPGDVVAVGWPEDVYKQFPRAIVSRTGLAEPPIQLADVELEIVRSEGTTRKWAVRLAHPDFERVMHFSLNGGKPLFAWREDNEMNLAVLRGEEKIDLLDYLAMKPLDFYLADFSRLRGNTLFRNDADSLPPFKQDFIQEVDWKKGGIDIELEFSASGLNTSSPQSVQDYFGQHLLTTPDQIIIFDHGAGEIADFISLLRESDRIVVSLFHCKGAGGREPGDRVGDVYEVCGQVVKSLGWLKSRETLRAKVQQRLQSHRSSSFLRGTPAELRQILGDDSPLPIAFRIGAVQPGLSAGNITEKIGLVLSSSADFVRRASSGEMWLFCSH